MKEQTFLESVNTKKPPELISAEETARNIADEFSGPGLKLIEDLIEKVKKAELAPRFNTNADMDIEVGDLRRQIRSQEGEAGVKRHNLASRLAGIQTDLISLADSLKEVVVDFEASKIK